MFNMGIGGIRGGHDGPVRARVQPTKPMDHSSVIFISIMTGTARRRKERR